MINYNWQKLNNYYKWNSTEVLKYFYFRTHVYPPAYLGTLSKKEKIDITKFNEGHSFLLRPEPLLLKHSSVIDMYEYIQIASLRNLFDYKLRGIDWVYNWQVPAGVNLDNPLITIADEKIYLKYDSNITGE